MNGKLKMSLKYYKGLIFFFKWNKTGDCLFSGFVDKTVIVWDAKMGDMK